MKLTDADILATEESSLELEKAVRED